MALTFDEVMKRNKATFDETQRQSSATFDEAARRGAASFDEWVRRNNLTRDVNAAIFDEWARQQGINTGNNARIYDEWLRQSQLTRKDGAEGFDETQRQAQATFDQAFNQDAATFNEIQRQSKEGFDETQRQAQSTFDETDRRRRRNAESADLQDQYTDAAAQRTQSRTERADKHAQDMDDRTQTRLHAEEVHQDARNHINTVLAGMPAPMQKAVIDDLRNNNAPRGIDLGQLSTMVTAMSERGYAPEIIQQIMDSFQDAAAENRRQNESVRDADLDAFNASETWKAHAEQQARQKQLLNSMTDSDGKLTDLGARALKRIAKSGQSVASITGTIQSSMPGNARGRGFTQGFQR